MTSTSFSLNLSVSVSPLHLFFFFFSRWYCTWLWNFSCDLPQCISLLDPCFHMSFSESAWLYQSTHSAQPLFSHNQRRSFIPVQYSWWESLFLLKISLVDELAADLQALLFFSLYNVSLVIKKNLLSICLSNIRKSGRDTKKNLHQFKVTMPICCGMFVHR